MGLLIQAIVVGGLLAQPSQPPKAGAEHRKLQLWTGEWTYEGETHTTFLGPGEKFTGTMSGRLIQDGFGLECVFVERGSSGETRTVEVDGYDPVAGNYPYVSVANNGNLYRGVFTLSGTVAKWEGMSVVKGKRFHDRGTDAVAPDGMSIVKRGEISEDGRTWVPSFTLRATKAKPAPAGRAK